MNVEGKSFSMWKRKWTAIKGRKNKEKKTMRRKLGCRVEVEKEEEEGKTVVGEEEEKSTYIRER